MYKNITAEIDDIAEVLETRGDKRLAARLDVVSNSLDAITETRTAAPNDMVPHNASGTNPGSEDADESARLDAYEAKEYHKMPVGKDSMSKAIGVNLKDIVGRLDFAQDSNEKEGQKISVQASGREAAEIEVDTGDPLDHFSTAGLEESGDEDKNPPVDKDEEGKDLEFYGYEKAGSLHMPGKKASKAAEAARRILAEVATAAEVDVEDPDTQGGPIVTEGPSKNLLGGPAASKKAAKEDEECDEDDEECKEANVEYAEKKASRTASRRKLSSIRTIVE